MATARALRPGNSLVIQFGGGLNTRDSPNELALNETPNSLNWTLDERGAIRLRNGCLNAAGLPGSSGTPAYIFYSAAINQWLCARSNGTTFRLYSRAGDLTGVWTDRGQLAADPANAHVSFADWPGSTPMALVTASTGTTPPGSGGIFSWDGTTFTSISTTIGGNAIALWQNRMWVSGYGFSNSTGNPTRVWASKIGDPTVWTAPDVTTVDIRDKDGSALQGMGIAGGSLVLFKQRSAYRVTDSATGAYSTIDSSAGALGPMAIQSYRGRLFTWGADSIYEWNGVGPGIARGDKARPTFTGLSSAVSDAPVFICAGILEDRLLWAYPSSVGGSNNHELEFDPVHDWLMLHQIKKSGGAVAQITSFAKKGNDLYAAVSNGDVIFKVFSETPGQDDGSNYFGAYVIPWIQPTGGKQARCMRAQVEGSLDNSQSDTLSLLSAQDWSQVSVTYDVTSSLRNANIQAAAIVRALGKGRSFQYQFLTGGTGLNTAVVSSLSLDFIPLEV